jgi:hypothetical protein
MLLDDIITLLGDDGASLTEALLKTKVLLHQIGKKDLAQWVNNELSGYPEATKVPDYRIIPSQVLANFANMAYRYTNHPIPLDHLKPNERDSIEKTRMWQSLSVFEQMISSSKDGKITRQIPMELCPYLRKGLDSSYHIDSAWCVMSVHDIKGICTQVRSRLLDFLLEVKDNVGEVTTESELREKSSSLDAQNLFNNAIFGPGATILIGHRSSITGHQTITVNEFAKRVGEFVEKVEQHLPNLPSSVRGDSQRALAELREAATASTPDVSRLRRGLEILGGVMEHATGHLVAEGVLSLIATLISSIPAH